MQAVMFGRLGLLLLHAGADIQQDGTYAKWASGHALPPSVVPPALKLECHR